MTRTVTDAAILLSVISEPDPRDWYALPSQGLGTAVDFTVGLDDGVEGLRIGFSPTLGGNPVDPEVAALVAKAAGRFEEIGATVEEVDPGLVDCPAAFRKLWYAGAAAVLNASTAEQKTLMDPGLVTVAAEGAGYSALDYMAAVKLREAIGVAMNLFHQDYDLLLTPSLPIAAFEVGLEVPRDSGMKRWPDWTPFSYPFNLTRQPAASVPCGLTSDGLPAGLQIVGPSYADALVLRAARAYEQIQPFKMPAL
jgi:aspartyl-tRNA(Asn)/glutamyl-tRNA(Gln) amidotransferase subunit A